jgi:DNA-binding response OmpR family regulator
VTRATSHETWRYTADLLAVGEHELVLCDVEDRVALDLRVPLTKLEFDVFQYLYERPGAVVEWAALLRDVWGYDAGGSNVIEALVKWLRRKLGDRSAAIETVRGLGYRFVAGS